MNYKMLRPKTNKSSISSLTNFELGYELNACKYECFKNLLLAIEWRWKYERAVNKLRLCKRCFFIKEININSKLANLMKEVDTDIESIISF